MKVCVFQGTFNPIHNTHIKMAEFVCENYGFEKIIFIPAAKPPHKDYDPQNANHRLNMVKLAARYNPQFEVSDIEFKLKDKSYSYFTALELHKQYDIDEKINFIIGTDAFEKIESWYKADEFKKLVDFIVFVRENDFVPERFQHLKNKGYNFQFAGLPFEDISSTEIRKKIAAGNLPDNLIPKAIEEYIRKHELYKNK